MKFSLPRRAHGRPTPHPELRAIPEYAIAVGDLGDLAELVDAAHAAGEPDLVEAEDLVEEFEERLEDSLVARHPPAELEAWARELEARGEDARERAAGGKWIESGTHAALEEVIRSPLLN
jgi:hypothetical protein